MIYGTLKPNIFLMSKGSRNSDKQLEKPPDDNTEQHRHDIEIHKNDKEKKRGILSMLKMIKDHDLQSLVCGLPYRKRDVGRTLIFFCWPL